MAGLFVSICKEVSNLIHGESFIAKHKASKNAFTRNRKIGFCENIAFILNSLSRTLQIELGDFVSNVLKKKDVQITKQAFSKSRKNISWKAFREIFALSRDMIFQSNSIKRINGYRIFAIDASEITFDKTHDIGEYFVMRPNAPDRKATLEFHYYQKSLTALSLMPASEPFKNLNAALQKNILKY